MAEGMGIRARTIQRLSVAMESQRIGCLGCFSMALFLKTKKLCIAAIIAPVCVLIICKRERTKKICGIVLTKAGFI